MMQAVKENWWHVPSEPELAWRPIDPYCLQEIPYYPVTVHWAGSSWKSDDYKTFSTGDFSEPYGIMLRRTQEDGTIRETDVVNETKFSNFLENDIIHTTIPPSQIKELWIRYHRVDRFAVDINTTMPNLEKIRMRGNWANLGHWDVSNLRKLNYFDISMNFIHTLNLPTTGENDTDNYFTYAYLGHFEKSDDAYDEQRPRPAEYENESAPRQVVNTLMRRAYYSNVSDSIPSSTEVKQFISPSCTGTLYYDDINYHNELCKRGWHIQHVSAVETVDFDSSSSGTAILEFLSTYFYWELIIPDEVDWLTADKYEGQHVEEDINGEFPNIQVNLTATANTTGAPRSTEVYIRKIKEYPRTVNKENEHWTEFHYRAKITVTQP